uniref:Uncharacterized protein n=1 Tax=Rhizophora mucronata TaxID=61149 RepID=A0A2P2IKT7_RHIMU
MLAWESGGVGVGKCKKEKKKRKKSRCHCWSVVIQMEWNICVSWNRACQRARVLL